MQNKFKMFPFFPILAIIFITLKLAGVGTVAAWSWLWVLSPLWIPFAIAFSIVVLFTIFAVIGKIILKVLDK